jgi:hypothetical protein
MYIAPRILNFITRWRQVVNFTPQPLYPREIIPVPIKQKIQWAPRDDMHQGKNLVPPPEFKPRFIQIVARSLHRLHKLCSFHIVVLLHVTSLTSKHNDTYAMSLMNTKEWHWRGKGGGQMTLQYFFNQRTLFCLSSWRWANKKTRWKQGKEVNVYWGLVPTNIPLPPS